MEMVFGAHLVIPNGVILGHRIKSREGSICLSIEKEIALRSEREYTQ